MSKRAGKIGPTASDRRVLSPKAFKEEKLAAGIRASETSNYLEAVKQFSLIKPDTTTSLYLGGCSRLELKYYSQTEEAIKDFSKCIALASQNEQLPFSLEVWYKRALAYHTIQKYDQAIQDYTEFIRRCRSEGEQAEYELHKGLIGRATTYQAMNELDIALRDVNEAIELTNTKDPYYLLCRASIYVSKNERKRAAEDLDTATRLGCGNDPEAIVQRANVYADLDKSSNALEDYKKALKINPKPTEQSDICYRAGLTAYKINTKPQAFQWFERAISLNPCNAQAYYYLGLMQREKGQYKEALKNLNLAHDYSPKQGDILIERALVHQHLGNPRAAEEDEKHGKELNSTPTTLVSILTERIKKIRSEKDRTGNSARTHLELAMAYDGLISQKKERSIQAEYYKNAVFEYRAAIKADNKYLYPHAHALLALCQRKMSHFNEAHEMHLEFYQVLSEHKGAIHHWKNYLVELEEQVQTGKLDPHLNETSVSQLLHMEANRRKLGVDQETLMEDQEDYEKNQLKFYQQMRIDLADLLTALSILNLESDVIIDNLDGATNRVARIIELISSSETSILTIESKLNGNDELNMKNLRKTDWNLIKMKLHSIGSVGDLADQLDVGQLVARHLCTRYHSQLLCLKFHSSAEQVEIVEQKSSWWKCCSRDRQWLFPEREVDGNDIIDRLCTFALGYIIHAINRDLIRHSSNERSARRDALATTLVLIVCQAHVNTDGKGLPLIRKGNERLPIDRTMLMKILKRTDLANADAQTLPDEWLLHSFFQSPGIFYRSDSDSGKIHYYKLGPAMEASVYGYRLGTREEVNVLKRLKSE